VSDCFGDAKSFRTANGTFDLENCRSLYDEKLKPVLMEFSPFLDLDNRTEFYVSLLGRERLLQPGKHVVDLGAGLSVFGPVCGAHGMKVTLVDDFGGGGGVELRKANEPIPVLEAFRNQFGIRIARENFLEHPLPLSNESIDAVTCFHSLEHWHHSPRRLFREIARVLKPGGILVMATPNAVNIRKRAYVLLGRSNFPRLREWYEDGDPIFRGHVREPVIRDLQELAEWNGLKVIGTHGRNFIGRQSEALAFLPARLVETLAACSDRLLRFFPSLCSDIHVVARKG
jgi:SAM-dependent methyltransferase